MLTSERSEEGGQVCCCDASRHVVDVQLRLRAVVRQVMGHVCQRLQDIVGYSKQEVRGQQPGEAEHTLPHWQRDGQVSGNQETEKRLNAPQGHLTQRLVSRRLICSGTHWNRSSLDSLSMMNTNRPTSVLRENETTLSNMTTKPCSRRRTDYSHKSTITLCVGGACVYVCGVCVIYPGITH